ncbi:MAG TPA: hypothetical protein DG753_12130 [Clostridium sp.]|nr:hypothetical protein [Clostridium sp.]
MMSSMNGCFSSKQKPYTLKANMLKFVNEKYGMEFIPTYFAMDDGVAQLVVYPKGGDREKDNFKVGWDKNKKTGKYEYKDSYSAIMMAPKYKEKIEELLKPYFESYLVEVRAEMCVLPNDFGVDEDFQKVIDRRLDYTPHVDIKVARSSDTIEEFNKKAEEFMNTVEEEKISGHIWVAYLKGTDFNCDLTEGVTYDAELYKTLEEYKK